jgi:hypothetical protein
MAMPQASAIREMWLLVNDDGTPVVAIDGEGEPGLVLFDEAEAKSEAQRQNELYDLNCRAVKYLVTPAS